MHHSKLEEAKNLYNHKNKYEGTVLMKLDGQGELACHQRATIPYSQGKTPKVSGSLVFIVGSTSNAPAMYTQWDSYL